MSARSRRPGSGKPRAPDLQALAGALAALPPAAPGPRAPRPDTKRFSVERLREPLRQAQDARTLSSKAFFQPVQRL